MVPRQAPGPTRGPIPYHLSAVKVVDGGDPSIGVGFRQPNRHCPEPCLIPLRGNTFGVDNLYSCRPQGSVEARSRRRAVDHRQSRSMGRWESGNSRRKAGSPDAAHARPDAGDLSSSSGRRRRVAIVGYSIIARQGSGVAASCGSQRRSKAGTTRSRRASTCARWIPNIRISPVLLHRHHKPRHAAWDTRLHGLGRLVITTAYLVVHLQHQLGGMRLAVMNNFWNTQPRSLLVDRVVSTRW